MSAPLDLCEWLGTATRGLPAQIKARIYDELTAHYQDAYDEVCAEGGSADDAHQKALARLGDARLTAKALRQTHLARRRYAWAMGAALASLLWVVVGALMMGSSLIFSLLAFALMLVVLRSFKSLLDNPIETIDAPSPITKTNVLKLPGAFPLIEVCTLVIIIAGIAGNLDGQHYPSTLMLTDPIIFGDYDLYPQEITPVHALITVAMVGVGIGWLLVSERLIDQGAALHRLAPLLRAFIMINGLAMIAAGVALLMRNNDAVILATLVGAPAGVARQALLTLLFYRAAFGVGQQSRPRGLA